MKGNKFIVYAFVCLMSACSTQKKVSIEEYISWITNPDNGMCQQKTIGQYTFSCQYQPSEFLAANNILQQNITITQATFDSAHKEYSGMQYVLLRIGSVDGQTDFLKQSVSSESEYVARIQYFTSEVQQDMFLVDGKDTLPCLMHHFERSFALSSENTMLLAFKNLNSRERKTVIYNDPVLGTGKIQFKIEEKQLKKIPAIEI